MDSTANEILLNRKSTNSCILTNLATARNVQGVLNGNYQVSLFTLNEWIDSIEKCNTLIQNYLHVHSELLTETSMKQKNV